MSHILWVPHRPGSAASPAVVREPIGDVLDKVLRSAFGFKPKGTPGTIEKLGTYLIIGAVAVVVIMLMLKR